jgi:hypothetical protein
VSRLLAVVKASDFQDLAFSEMLASLFVQEHTCSAMHLLSVKGASTHVLCKGYVTNQLRDKLKPITISIRYKLPASTLLLPTPLHRATFCIQHVNVLKVTKVQRAPSNAGEVTRALAAGMVFVLKTANAIATMEER